MSDCRGKRSTCRSRSHLMAAKTVLRDFSEVVSLKWILPFFEQRDVFGPLDSEQLGLFSSLGQFLPCCDQFSLNGSSLNPLCLHGIVHFLLLTQHFLVVREQFI